MIARLVAMPRLLRYIDQAWEWTHSIFNQLVGMGVMAAFLAYSKLLVSV